MTTYSANLGFLWADLPLPEAIRAAKRAGFAAVECHWPYSVPPEDVASALRETGLPMLGLNTVKGGPQDFGLAALPGREAEARASIDQAISYAEAIDAAAIHVMAGKARGEAARACFLANLRHACAATSRTILIEPLNSRDVPGYFHATAAEAVSVIEEVGAANLKLMFDCYHLQIMGGDLSRQLEELMPLIGHIQIAAVPSRAEPDEGEVAYAHILAHLDRLGYARPIGAEYRPRAGTDAGLGWMAALEADRGYRSGIARP